jgi:TetR/AcrR family transcriptional repressor of nem operon
MAYGRVMGRPRAFDEDEVVRAAADLFGHRSYDGVSIDDLVTHLGIHRNSLYKTFGSKRGLYLRALRWHLETQVRSSGDADWGLFLLAAIERAPVDAEVAAEISAVLADLDDGSLGRRVRARATTKER